MNLLVSPLWARQKIPTLPFISFPVIFWSAYTISQMMFEHCGYNVRMLRPIGQRVIPPLEYVMTDPELVNLTH
jgi:hypothetical protein